jgi:hypothetical protein
MGAQGAYRPLLMVTALAEATRLAALLKQHVGAERWHSVGGADGDDSGGEGEGEVGSHRIVALHHRFASTSYKIYEENRCLSF